jgi:hypothetical protein
MNCAWTSGEVEQIGKPLEYLRADQIERNFFWKGCPWFCADISASQAIRALRHLFELLLHVVAVWMDAIEINLHTREEDKSV